MPKITFTFSDIFPSDDLLSEWLLTISMAANDLVTVHDRMEKDQDDEARSLLIALMRL